MLLLQLKGNMFSCQLYLIVGANVAATIFLGTTATIVNSKILPSTTTSDNNKMDNEVFVEFLRNLTQEQHFTSIVILTNGLNNYRSQRDSSVNLQYYMDYEQKQQQNWLKISPIPVILLQSLQQDFILHNSFNSEFLTMICLPSLDSPPLQSSYQRENITRDIQHHLLSALSKNLWYLRQNRIIIRMDIPSHHKTENLKSVANILKYCDREQILNVIVISYEFPYTDLEYYSYSKFPKFKMRKQRWIIGETQLFPNQLRDVKGYTLRTIPDQIEPRSMVYYDKNGVQQMCGYMGNFFKYFAESINASWKFAYKVKVGEYIFFAHILNFTRNNSIDVPVSQSGPINDTDWSEYSYPHEIFRYCVMLPIEAELSSAEIFFAILNPTFIALLISLLYCFSLLLIVMLKKVAGPLYRFSWVDLLLNDKAFRAILGQGFPFIKTTLDYFKAFVFFLLFITGLIVVTLHGVVLGSYMTSPPKKPAIKSFDDLAKSPLKILISREEYNLNFSTDSLHQYHNLFHVASRNYSWEQLRLRNTSYAYVMPNFIWNIVAEQQKRFSRPLFRYATDLCFDPFMHSYLFLPLHSVFRESLHFATLNVYASGLFDHWFELGFYELVSLGRMSLADLAVPYKITSIAVSDLKFVFIGFYISLLCSLGIFLSEFIISFLGKSLTSHRI